MTIFLATLLVLGLFFLAMSIGLFFSRAPIKGSCGGLAGIPGLGCGICKKKCERRKKS